MHTSSIARGLLGGALLVTALGLTGHHSAAAAMTTVTVAADARVDALHPGRPHPRGVLRVRRSPSARAYLRFAVPARVGAIARVTLVLTPRSASRAGVVVMASSAAWSEAGITLRNAPPARVTRVPSGPIGCCAAVSIDVTRLVRRPGSVTLVLASGARRGAGAASFASREMTASMRPRLVIRSAGGAAPSPSGSPPGTVAPAPSPGTGPGSPPGQPPVLTPFPSWNGDLSTGNWSQYDSRPDASPDGRPQDFAIVTHPVPRGFGFAGAFTVGPNSIVSDEAGTRALTTLWPDDEQPAAAKSRAYEGADSWYRDAFYLPSSFVPAPYTTWNWLWEMHNSPDGPGDANLQLGIVTDSSDGGPAGGERLSLWVMGGASAQNPVDEKDYWCRCNPDIRDRWMRGLASVPRERWVDVVIHVRWTWRSSGLVEWWIDGVKAGTYSGPTLFYYGSLGGPGQAYLQHGYYRPRGALPTVTVYHGATMIGPSAASVGSSVR